MWVNSLANYQLRCDSNNVQNTFCRVIFNDITCEKVAEPTVRGIVKGCLNLKLCPRRIIQQRTKHVIKLESVSN